MYTPNPDTPEWDYRVVYEVTIDLAAFGDAGFSGAFIDYVHASPAKSPDNTIEVTPGECPPCEPQGPDDDRCSDQGPPPDDDGPCMGDTPDADCGGGDPPPPEEPPYCLRYPTDPKCIVD